MAAISRLTDNSPTASLLRNSRLFSLPQPLPRPNIATAFGDRLRNSDSASTPYPTHQVIATTDASRARGDWGFKRPLPLKSTATSRGIRMRALDTHDQVTEFESGHGHAITLKKLQELGLCVARRNQKSFQPFKVGPENRFERLVEPVLPSAFESAYDNTAPDALSLEQSHIEKFSKESRLLHRWRSRGPEIKGLSSAEFDHFLDHRLRRNQRDNFDSFLKTFRIKSYLRPIADDIYDEGNRSPDLVKELIKWLDQSTLPEAESYLVSYCNSSLTRQNVPKSCRGWMKPWTPAQTPAWMPPKPAQPASFEAYAWNGTLAHRLVYGRRQQETQTLIDDDTVGGDASEAEAQGIGAVELRMSRSFDKSSANQNYTEEERAYVDNLLEQTQQHFFAILDSNIVSSWPTWLAQFRATSGSNKQNRHIIEYFLDLPQSVNSLLSEESPDMATHPSAGVSYRRSSRTIVNHPIFGPLDGPELVQARHVPSGRIGRMVYSYRSPANAVGLAGLIMEPAGDTWNGKEVNINAGKRETDDETSLADAATRGTARAWISVESARVQSDGRLIIGGRKPDQPKEYVAERKLEQDIRDDAEAAKNPIRNIRRAPRAAPLNLLPPGGGGGGLVQGGRVMEPLDNDGKSQP